MGNLLAISKNDFKALELFWYNILKETGFEDAEDTSKDDRPLRFWNQSRFNRKTIIQQQAAQDYYDKAKMLLIHYKFENEIERKIWELFCEGLGKRNIAKELKKFLPPQTGPRGSYRRERIGLILIKLKKEIK